MILSTGIRALRGRVLWVRTKRKYNINQGGIYVLLMPDSDRELNERALRHIDDFLAYRRGSSVVILTTDEWVMKNANRFTGHILAVERISARDSFYYRCYSYYYGFSEQFIVISLQGGYGERLALAKNINGITKEDLTCLGLYIIRNWRGEGAANG